MNILFYLFAVLAVLGASSVLYMRNPVYCTLSLVGAFFSLGVIYVLLNSEFIATVQVLVYAGAIMVLFLFVIMLLNVETEKRFPFRWRPPQVIGAVLAGVIFVQLVGLFANPRSQTGPLADYPADRLAREGTVETIGQLLFTDYVLPFEVISVLLLVAIIGAVVLAKRRVKNEGTEGQ
ncbi:MAG: NADH-quinone oxidoreductase subunit J [Deltaproteobacteria bacterium]|nr:NADH-quinone oxidoreductase subunit J [Deltaproteobacteria bacterium]